ncbi:MAG: TetR/AcrR family transcriptional regulator [Ilumatobacteraceae bacterium]
MLTPENLESAPKRRTRADGRETAKRIIHFAQQELESAGLVNFNLDRVIEASGVSRSSVYHHFGGREGVIAAVETEFLRSSLDAGMTEMTEMLSKVQTGEEAFTLVELGVLVSGSEKQKAIRRRRISNLAMVPTSPATKKLLVTLQGPGTERFADLLRDLRDRGLCQPIEPIEGTAHLIQSILLGRILVDILEDPFTEAQWSQTVSQTLRFLLQPRSEST